jgi:hypothetical protein
MRLSGLSTSRPTEGEGVYIGCHDGSCRTSGSIFEGNYIHHTRGTSDGGNDGVEIKAGSYGNIVRNNVIHDTSIDRKYFGMRRLLLLIPILFAVGLGAASEPVRLRVDFAKPDGKWDMPSLALGQGGLQSDPMIEPHIKNCGSFGHEPFASFSVSIIAFIPHAARTTGRDWTANCARCGQRAPAPSWRSR